MLSQLKTFTVLVFSSIVIAVIAKKDYRDIREFRELVWSISPLNSLFTVNIGNCCHSYHSVKK